MKKRMKTLGTNAIDTAAPASKFGKGVPGKGGKTTNFAIPDWMFNRELKDMINARTVV